MTLSEELQWRGFYNQTTFDSPTVLDEQQFTLYLGTDPSGDSLHVGHLAVYMMVRRFLDHGHNVILLVGGGTGLIGDMRDTEERVLKPLEEVKRNSQALKRQVETLFSGQSFEMVDNYDWLKDITIIPFLRDIGKMFTMNELTSREFYKARTGEHSTGLSYAEFTYTILQGYDYFHLHESKGVNLQIGGSDQWGNLLSGVELIRKKTGHVVNALSSPLVINKTTGRKFGKSEGGAIWLDSAKTSVYAFYQFWLNTDDASAIEYLKLFTLLGKDEIETVNQQHSNNTGQRVAQKRLAYEVTALVHGIDRTQSVIRVTDVLFGSMEFMALSDEEIIVLANEIPVVTVGQTISDALIAAGIVSSKGESRRLIQNGGVSVNGSKITEDIPIETLSLIKKGKNTFILAK
ncbi:tyrosine--tRNA ligase [bacterium]|nr:MAG: tyrosine--tRNA ligase [bacterium]